MNKYIDLNCDMGESFGAWNMGADREVMPWVTSVNIACGYHAGDPVTMRATVRAAMEAGVALGAHVALPDLMGFGRRAMAVSPGDLHAMTIVQMGALVAMARSEQGRVGHLKPHGALYHMAESEPDLAEAIVSAVASLDPDVRIVGLAGGMLVARAREAGLACAEEGFVDRRYQQDGSLEPRGTQGAVIENPEQALEQALALARDGQAPLAEGGHVRVRADTLCVHGDRDNAAEFARTIHEGLRKAGVELRALGPES
ncbi:MAG: 5-oxoprolinase subunit PxpA [Rhodanobacteraceae bacterium]